MRPRALSVLRDLAQYPAFIQERRIERMVERLTVGRDSAWFFEGAPPERVERFARDVDSLATHVRAVGARLVVVNHPIKFRSINDPGAYAGLQGLRQFGARALPETILAFDSAGDLAARRVAERQGADFVNARAVMSGKPELFADPVHYSPLGAAVLAGEIARAIHAPAH